MENLNDASQAADTTAVSSEQTVEATPRASIDRAFEQAFSDAPQSGTDSAADVVTPPSQDREENGRFKAKEAQTDTQAQEQTAKPESEPVDVPSRFSPDAKAAWEATPAPVKSEIKRAFTEMEKGLAEYQTRWEPLKQFDDLAKQSGTTIPQALTNYINLERDLTQNPVQGLQKIFDYIGMNPREYAAQVLGQPADQTANQQDTIIRELRTQIATLQQQVGTVSTTIEQQNMQALESQIAAFAADKPRFEELRVNMGKLMEAGLAQDLDDAYEMADRLNPAPIIASPKPAAPAAKDLTPHTPKGSLPVTGAPVSGSNPAARKPSTSARSAIDNAFASLGIG